MKHMEHVHMEINLQKHAEAQGMPMVSHTQNKAKNTYHLSAKGTKRYKKDGMTRRPLCACQHRVNKSKKHINYTIPVLPDQWKLITCDDKGQQCYQFHWGLSMITISSPLRFPYCERTGWTSSFAELHPSNAASRSINALPKTASCMS